MSELESDQRKRTTLQDIAARTGLSRATVCRAINGLPNVSAAALSKIRKAAAELEYRPDPALSALSKYRWSRADLPSQKYSIALISNKSFGGAENPDYHSIARTLAECAATHDIRYEHFFFEDFRSPTSLGSHLYHIGYEGLVVRLAQPMQDWAFPWQRFAIVTIGFDHPSHSHHRIVGDFGGAMRLAFAKAWERGSRRPGVLLFLHQHPVLDGILRGAAYDCLISSGLAGTPPIFIYDHTDISSPSAARRFKKWFKKHHPDHIIDGNFLGLNWLPETLGLRPHLDIGYSSLMGANAKGFAHPGVDYQYGLQAMFAFEKALQLLQLNRRGPSSTPLRSVVPCKWLDAHREPQS